MCYRPLAYDDPDTATTMRADCQQVADRLPGGSTGRPAQHDEVTSEISVDEATVRLATALDLGRG